MAVLLCFPAVNFCRAATSVIAWGADTAGQCDVPGGLTNATAVAGGDSHSLALKGDGSVISWGQAPAPPVLTNAIAIAAGQGYGLALKSSGSIVVWGGLAAAPTWLTNATAIATGWDPSNPWNHGLAIRSDSTVVAWGDNTWGQTNVPPGLSNVVGIAAGDGNSLALLANGTIVAWGDDSFGKSEVPAGLTNVSGIAAGQDHVLALLANGTVVAWGNNLQGQATVPPNATNIVAIAAGQLHSLALKTDSTVVAWGDNRYGQSTVSSAQSGFVSIAGGGAHSLAIKTAGAPAFLQQPASQTVLLGNDATFSVMAVGPQPITYQWRFNTTNLVSATNSTLTVSKVKMSDGGSYTVVAANFYGTATSAVAVLTPITSPPVITVPPQNLTTNCGDVAIFQVGVSGSSPFGYQWFFNGTPIDSATNASLAVSNVTPNLTGSYSVIITNLYGSATSAAATLTMSIDSSLLITPLQAFGRQGSPFAYAVPARRSPISYGAQYLPAGLAIDPVSGIISGIPLQSGTFGVLVSVTNACTHDTKTLVLTLTANAPAITSSLNVTATQNTPITYRIRASNSPTSFGALNLPVSLVVDPVTGIISGTPLYTGDFYSTIWASNVWGVGSATLHFHINNATLAGLSIANVTTNYSSPYLVGFQFSLRDNDDPNLGNPLAIDPSLLTVTPMENGIPISSSESDYFISVSTSRRSKTFLVLDFTESIASVVLNGDSNNDGISDAVDNVVLGAQVFVNSQPPQAQIGVYEFHNEDSNPTNVVKLTTDKNYLNQQIAGIWTNYVKNYPGGSRCWDALYYAVTNLGAPNGDEYHNIVFVSDGQDVSSFNSISNVINAATNNNVRIYCVGFGAELDPNILQSITDQTLGRYYTATDPTDLSVQFAQIGAELAGSYFLRWPTVKRTATTFMPSFSISYQGLTANSPTNPWYMQVVTNDPGPPIVLGTNFITNFIISYFSPTKYAGNAAVGTLRLITNASAPPMSVTLHADYIPRYVQQFSVNYRPNWPCTSSLQSAAPGGLLYGWTMTETNDGAGGRHILMNSPGSTSNLLYGGLGDLVTFTFRDIVSYSNAFSVFTNDNSVYTGGQSFLLPATNVSPFITFYTNLPHSTPIPWLLSYGFTTNLAAAEAGDQDHDGTPTWEEFQANTNPTNGASKFAVSPLAKALDGRFLITFSTSTNRTYRVLSSTNLVDWVTVQDFIPGVNTNVTVTDTTFYPGPSVFYRVLAY